MRMQLISFDISAQERYELAAQALYDARLSRDKVAIRIARAELFAAENTINENLARIERL